MKRFLLLTIATALILGFDSAASFVKCGVREAESCDKCVDSLSPLHMHYFLAYSYCLGDCMWDHALKKCKMKEGIAQ